MRKPSLFSKIKKWLTVHNVPVFLPFLVFGIALGTTLFAIVAHLLQWDVVGALLSRTALLIYVIIFTAVVGYIWHLWENSHK